MAVWPDLDRPLQYGFFCIGPHSEWVYYIERYTHCSMYSEPVLVV